MKYALIFVLILAFAACPQSMDAPRIKPLSACGISCTTSSQCDGLGSCHVCGVNGRCASGLPAEPLQLDAGIDAAGGTAP